MNDRQLEALAYGCEHGRTANRKYRHVCPFWHFEALRLDLADLTRCGLSVKIGHKRGTCYIARGPAGLGCLI